MRCVWDASVKRNVVEALIEHGADPNARNAQGRSPLEVAARQPEILAALAGERTTARPYSPKTTFVVGERIAHPTFGEGPVRKLSRIGRSRSSSPVGRVACSTGARSVSP